jgi:hypothetical protein
LNAKTNNIVTRELTISSDTFAATTWIKIKMTLNYALFWHSDREVAIEGESEDSELRFRFFSPTPSSLRTLCSLFVAKEIIAISHDVTESPSERFCKPVNNTSVS